MALLNNNQCIILVGETGSGKSIQIPQWYIIFTLYTNMVDKCLPIHFALI